MTSSASLTIYADYGEEHSGLIEILRDYGVKVELKRLPVGDFLLSSRVGVERKTTNDFAQSIKGKRLFKQIIELKENFSRPLMIIEGQDLYSIRGMHPNAIRGALALITVVHGIPVLITRNPRDTATFLWIIARQEQEYLNYEVSLYGKRKAPTLKEEQKRILEAIPQIGPVLADSLLAHFGSVEKVVQASPEELMQVYKIGKKKAMKIREVLEAPYQSDRSRV